MNNFISHIHCTYRESGTRFEDLANEIICEIFDYLDAYHIYQSFIKLNARFQKLLLHGKTSIKASISTLSKSAFENYYTDFIRPIQHRLKALHLSDPFMVVYIFPIAENISSFARLQTLHLENIELRCLQDVLQRLAILPSLSSLTVHVNHEANIIHILNRLFQLPVLKYCELIFKRNFQLEALPISTTISSPIEQLIIHNCSGLNRIEALLSYVPKLRRLSITGETALIFISILLNSSKQYSFGLVNLPSNDLQPWMEKHSDEIKLVHICSMDKWYNGNIEIEKKLMPFHSTSMKIISCNDKTNMLFDHTYQICTPLITRHSWLLDNIQQWFFTHELMSEEKLHGILCSFASHK